MKQPVSLFFAVDENYLPYLSVSLCSVKAHADRSRKYTVTVLHSGIGAEAANRITSMSEDNFVISFVDVSERLAALGDRLQLRDYYTHTTYYRIFIAEMFPELDKALYIDSDTVALADVGQLFDSDLGSNLVGGVPDETVGTTPIFRTYVEEALGVPADDYFNAGVLLMNLKAFREENFYAGFTDLLGKYKFSVAQDQDYLNVLCKGRVLFVSPLWNKMPIPSPVSQTPKLVHYNLTRKPWHYPSVLYREYFWEYAEKTDYYREITAVRDAYGEDRRKADAACEQSLLRLAESESVRPDNYRRVYA